MTTGDDDAAAPPVVELPEGYDAVMAGAGRVNACEKGDTLSPL